jgi:cobyrinic acid a,c-diamide synthase
MLSAAPSQRPTPPGLLIAAVRSGSGKTVLTLGLLRALHRAGVTVGSAKCGPDYIDGRFHQAATGRTSVNLDSWAMTPDSMLRLAGQVAEGCDVVICEALMGLFDGVPGAPGRTGSSADVAAAMGWPVLLVLDASGQAQSAAAIVKGCMTFDPRIRIAGVVLNRVGSERHVRLITDAIATLGLPVVGAIPRTDQLALPERHLGLVQAGETQDLDARLDQIADVVARHVDIAGVRSLAAGSAATPCHRAAMPALRPPGQRIAVARDAAFSFLYPHMLTAWRAMGAEMRYFSPLADEAPDDDCDACWLPGGYPELHATKLAAASNFMAGLRRFADAAKPIHGECGGYMVLGRTLTDGAGTTHEMAGLLGLSTSFAKRKLHLGYREATLLATGCLGPGGTLLRGHEFHYATIVEPGDDAPLAMVCDAYGSEKLPAGSQHGSVSGSFFHLIACAS